MMGGGLMFGREMEGMGWVDDNTVKSATLDRYNRLLKDGHE